MKRIISLSMVAGILAICPASGETVAGGGRMDVVIFDAAKADISDVCSQDGAEVCLSDGLLKVSTKPSDKYPPKIGT